jgi:anti-anti-sigma factor
MQPSTIEIHQRSAGSVTVLDLVGSLVLSEGTQDRRLKEALSTLIGQGLRRFVVNLAGVSQIDTAGLTTLVAAHLVVTRRGGRLKLANPTRRIREVFGVTRLNSFFDVCETEEEALSTLEQDAGDQRAGDKIDSSSSG